MGLLDWLFRRKVVTLEGGPGDTTENAVVVRGAGGAMRGVSAEYRYLGERFGRPGVDWRVVEQALWEGEDGKHFDVFTLSLKDQRTVEVYFDISEFYGKAF